MNQEALKAKKEKVSVVIPIYQTDLSFDERKSLEQCVRVLGNYPLVLVCPQSLKETEVEKYFKTKVGLRWEKKTFADTYFKGIRGYNRLMLSHEFYQAFENYEYILIHQTDAYVFKDELSLWCDRGYDYIGAPWFRTFWKWRSQTRLWASGNGGFSLRKIDAFLRVLQYQGKFTPLRSFFSFHNSPLLKLKKMPKKELLSLKFENSVRFFRAINQNTEDRFWALDVKNSYLDFKVADPISALAFAFECNPRQMYLLYGEKLPFACHAWQKYDAEFWDEVYFCKLKNNQ